MECCSASYSFRCANQTEPQPAPPIQVDGGHADGDGITSLRRTEQVNRTSKAQALLEHSMECCSASY